MKTLGIVIISIIILFIVAQRIIHSSSTNIESYPFTLIEHVGDIEIRQYEARLFTSVPLAAASYSDASSKGFSKLGGYIFGANESEETIAMTSPVSMRIGDKSAMEFMVPKSIPKDALPTPNEADITFKEVPSKKMAVITFGGWANDEKIASYKKELIGSLNEKGIAFNNNFYLFGYNPPYDLFFRKNEVAVELE